MAGETPPKPLHPPTLESAKTDSSSPLHPPTLKSAKTDSSSPLHPPTLKSAKTDSSSPLDPLVKIALGLSIGLIVITIIGMILTAPDRSIPPYSVMAQVGEVVSVNVPPRTTDAEIEALLFRFRAAGEGDRDTFRRMKIQPTTPADPRGVYQQVTIYILGNPGLAEESVLRDYRAGQPAARGAFERAVRGVYRLTADSEFGALGFVGSEATAAGAPLAGSRILFQTHLDQK